MTHVESRSPPVFETHYVNNGFADLNGLNKTMNSLGYSDYIDRFYDYKFRSVSVANVRGLS